MTLLKSISLSLGLVLGLLATQTAANPARHAEQFCTCQNPVPKNLWKYYWSSRGGAPKGHKPWKTVEAVFTFDSKVKWATQGTAPWGMFDLKIRKVDDTSDDGVIWQSHCSPDIRSSRDVPENWNVPFKFQGILDTPTIDYSLEIYMGMWSGDAEYFAWENTRDIMIRYKERFLNGDLVEDCPIWTGWDGLHGRPSAYKECVFAVDTGY